MACMHDDTYFLLSSPFITDSKQWRGEREREKECIMDDGEREKQLQEMPEEERKKKMRWGACGWLRGRRVRELVRDKRRLVEVPYTATLSQAVSSLVANNVAAAPVAAPPGRWIGAGGSLILESDPVTGAVRKHYIGMLTMLDVLLHIADEEDGGAGEEGGLVDLDRKMAVKVSSIIGHSLEGLSLWTLNPNTSILDCMETFSKGVHRALVPLESQVDNVVAVELTEASPGYRMLTQMDVLNFLRTNANEIKDIISRSVGSLGAIHDCVFAVTGNMKAIYAIKSMRSFALHAVPIVESSVVPGDDEILQDGKGRELIGTFSATDLRGYSISQLQSWLSLSVMEFKERVSTMAAIGSQTTAVEPAHRKLITCYPETSLAEVIDHAVAAHVHRVWAVDPHGLLLGVVSLTDMLRVIRESVLRADHELQEVVSDEPLVL